MNSTAATSSSGMLIRRIALRALIREAGVTVEEFARLL
jgi:hypothetical protein